MNNTILDNLLQEKLNEIEEPKSKKKEKDYSIFTKDEKTLLYKNGLN